MSLEGSVIYVIIEYVYFTYLEQHLSAIWKTIFSEQNTVMTAKYLILQMEGYISIVIYRPSNNGCNVRHKIAQEIGGGCNKENTVIMGTLIDT